MKVDKYKFYALLTLSFCVFEIFKAAMNQNLWSLIAFLCVAAYILYDVVDGDEDDDATQ